MSPYVSSHLSIDVGSPGGSIMQLTVVPVLLQSERGTQELVHGLAISDLIATVNENNEPDRRDSRSIIGNRAGLKFSDHNIIVARPR